MRVKNHHIPATIRVEMALKNENEIKEKKRKHLYGYHSDVLSIFFYFGERSLPCCINEPIVNHIELTREKSLINTSLSVRQGCGLSHSYGLNLQY
jgi:hypothetical protein